MKILGLMCSPRKGGNTDTLLDIVLKNAQEQGAHTQKVNLQDISVAPCSAEEYEEVTPEGYPLVKDDIYDIIDKMRWADAVIVASPIFFGSLSAQAKTMIDRFQCVWLAKNAGLKDLFPERKKGVFICCEATDRPDFIQNASSIVKHFFATCNIDYAEEIFCKGVEDAAEVLERSGCVSKAKKTGKLLAGEVE